MAPIDFTLPDDKGGEVVFDRAFRERNNALLVFYRGWW